MPNNLSLAPKPKWWLIPATISATVLLVAIIIFSVKLFTPTAPGAAPISALKQTETQEIDLKIKGNKNSKIYHLSHCPNYSDIAERNIVWFKTHDEAEKAGFRVARNCN